MKKHVIFFISLFTLNSKYCYTQIFIIYKDDSLFKTIIDTNKISVFENNFRFKLKNKLPSGTYIVYNTSRTSKEARQDSNRFLIFKGDFKDSLREGQFEFYDEHIKRKIPNLTLSETYKNGLLHGSYSEYNSSEKHYVGFYQNGKKEGFFITYNDKKEVTDIYYYEFDIKKSSVTYENNILYSNYKLITDNKEEYKFYDSKGNIWACFLYEQNQLKRIVEYYKNGEKKCEKEGEFLKNNTDIQFSLDVLLTKPIIHGYTKMYNEEGGLVSEDIK